MSLYVQGMHCLGSFGSGAEDLWNGLKSPLPSIYADGRAAISDTATLTDFLPAKSLRQVDHLTRMSLLCAFNALKDAKWDWPCVDKSTGLVLVTGYGPAALTFDFLDSIIEHGELMASPLAFSRSVQNIPAASVAMKLNLVGPCSTVCQLESSVATGLLLAQTWLDEGRVERVIFGAIDEHTPFLAQVTHRLTEQKMGRDMNRKHFRSSLPLGEGAAFFCLDSTNSTAGYGIINSVSTGYENPQLILQEILDNDFQNRFDRIFISGDIPNCLYSLPNILRAEVAYGNLPISQAFDLVFAFSEKLQIPQQYSHNLFKTICINLNKRGYKGIIETKRYI